MGLLSKLKDKKKYDSSYEFDFDGIEIEKRAYLKSMALEMSINFLSRSVSQSTFRITKGHTRVYDDWDYLLNVRPNVDQSATDFWQRFTYKLIADNEVLVILSDKNDLLVADSFSRIEYAVYPDLFQDVTVNGYTFLRTFNMDEVIHIEYNNDRLEKFMNGMFEDYTELFSRMIQTSMFSNQIRATAGIDSSQNLSDENISKLNKFIGKMFDSFKKNAFAIVPKLKGFDYEEITSGSNAGRSIEDVTKISDKAIEHVAQLLGIPAALIRGELSDYETAVKSYIKFTYNPLIKKIEDELNAKLISKKEYFDGKRIRVERMTADDPIDLLNKVGKGVASGLINPNEGRVEYLGLEPSDDPAMDKYYITKNYAEAGNLEGGEKNNEETI